MKKKKNMKNTAGLLCMGVLALSLSACGSVNAQEIQTQPLSAAAPVQSTDEAAGKNTEAGQSEPEELFINLAKEALLSYFDVDMADTAGYSVSVQHMEAMPEFDAEAQTAVTFLPDELNLGEISADAGIDMENIQTKPMYDVTFTEEGKIKGIHLSYVDWKSSEKPVNAESAKDLAKDFAVSHGLAEESSLKILGSATTSSDTISVVIRRSEGRALVIGVDSLAGRVRFFEDMPEKSAVNSITPLEEGKGLG